MLKFKFKKKKNDYTFVKISKNCTSQYLKVQIYIITVLIKLSYLYGCSNL